MTRIRYVLEIYPRFSETFIVTEILTREAHGGDLRIYALRSTTDARFYPEIARVRAQVSWVPRPAKASEFWAQLSDSLRHEDLRRRFAELTPDIAGLSADEVAQGISLAASVIDDGIDRLHAHFASLAGRMAWLASRLTGVPYTITMHAKDIYHESVDRGWLRRICGDADRAIAISRFNERYLNEVLDGTGARISPRYNALELERFPYRDPIQPSLPLRVATVERLVPKKDLADLIDIVAALEVPAELDIAGSGKLHDELAARIERLDLGNHVRLVGPLTQNEVSELIRGSHVFAAPCIPADNGNIDGLPTVVLEAMTLGTPVVATSVSGLPEVVCDGLTGILIDPGNVAALTHSLAELAAEWVLVVTPARNARVPIEEQFNSRRQAATLSTWEGGH